MTRQIANVLALIWGIAVAMVIYNIASDLPGVLGTRTHKKAQPERRFIEPCAADMHTYDDEGLACTTCKQAKEPPLT